MEKEIKDLTEEQILQKMHMLEDFKIQEDTIKIEITDYEKMIELKLPERKIRNALLKKQDELRNTQRNIKILEKQIRTKTETFLNE